ncbi:Uncharacterised protein [Mycobacteroides abscessus]|nr:Uncharacterised protein [Mycobacteroides abscessus]
MRKPSSGRADVPEYAVWPPQSVTASSVTCWPRARATSACATSCRKTDANSSSTNAKDTR